MTPMPRIKPSPRHSDPELDRLLDAARGHEITEAEIRVQRASWVRGEMGIGNDRAEEAYRAKMRPATPAPQERQ